MSEILLNTFVVIGALMVVSVIAGFILALFDDTDDDIV